MVEIAAFVIEMFHQVCKFDPYLPPTISKGNDKSYHCAKFSLIYKALYSTKVLRGYVATNLNVVQFFGVCILDSEAKAQCILSYSNDQTRS